MLCRRMVCGQAVVQRLMVSVSKIDIEALTDFLTTGNWGGGGGGKDTLLVLTVLYADWRQT